MGKASRMKQLRRSERELAERVSGPVLAERLEEWVARRLDADQRIGEHVVALRAQGWSWRQIGEKLGRSGEAARARYGAERS